MSKNLIGYLVEIDDFEVLRIVMNRLYNDMEKLNADDMRNLAQALNGVIDRAIEWDRTEV